MGFVKRAFYSINRKKGKTIILFLVLFILSNLIAISFSIQLATAQVEKTTKESLGGVVSIVTDQKRIRKWEKENEKNFWDEEGNREKLNPPQPDVLDQMGALDSVDYFDYSIGSHLESDKLKNVRDENPDDAHMSYRRGSGEMSYFQIKGVNLPELFDIKAKKIQLSKGKIFTTDQIDKGEGVVIVSEKFAEINNLSVGSSFDIGINVTDWDAEKQTEVIKDSESITVKIVGLFTLTEEEENKIKAKASKKNRMYMWDDDNEIYNVIYVPNKFSHERNKKQGEMYRRAYPEHYEFENTNEKQKEIIYTTPYFVLKNPDLIEEFSEEIIPLIGEYQKVIANTDQYEKIAAPIQSMKSLSKIILIASVLVTILVTSLIVVLFLRERKHELGIYLALGEKKIRVLSQVVIEVLVIAFVAVSLSMISGKYVANLVSNKMLDHQIKTMEEEEEDDFGGWNEADHILSQYRPNIEIDDVRESFEKNMEFGAQYILIFYLIGIGTCFVSSVLPMVYILRLNPKQILL